MREAKDKDQILQEEDGFLHIYVAHCIWCERVTLAPSSDVCGCGRELYPVERRVPLGEPLSLDNMKGS